MSPQAGLPMGFPRRRGLWVSDTTVKDTGGTSFTPDYTATLEDTSTVMQCAGPR